MSKKQRMCKFMEAGQIQRDINMTDFCNVINKKDMSIFCWAPHNMLGDPFVRPSMSSATLRQMWVNRMDQLQPEQQRRHSCVPGAHASPLARGGVVGNAIDGFPSNSTHHTPSRKHHSLISLYWFRFWLPSTKLENKQKNNQKQTNKQKAKKQTSATWERSIS